MNALSRRNALRAIGLGAPAAGFVAEKFKRDMVISPGVSNVASGQPGPPCSESLKFTSFGDWLKRIGYDALKGEARLISGFDGDIIDMHLPMTTKCRMQRARNYARLLEGRKHWFSERLGAQGFVTDWL